MTLEERETLAQIGKMLDELCKSDADDGCDYCTTPLRKGCDDSCKCPYPFGECCEDNLETNVAKILFDNDIPNPQLANALIQILKKERERYECMYLFGEHLEDR